MIVISKIVITLNFNIKAFNGVLKYLTVIRFIFLFVYLIIMWQRVFFNKIFIRLNLSSIFYIFIVFKMLLNNFNSQHSVSENIIENLISQNTLITTRCKMLLYK